MTRAARIRLLFVLLPIAALTATTATAGLASRPAPRADRLSIEHLVWADLQLRTTRARRCVPVRVTISTVDPRFALAEPLWHNSGGCLRYAANGEDIVRRDAHGVWRIVFRGSDPPACHGNVPAAVTRDLVKLRCLTR
jgi:hypothetical protein